VLRRAARARRPPRRGGQPRSQTGRRAVRLRLHRHERRGLRVAPQRPRPRNVVDVSELVTEPRARRHPLPLRVAFQDSCHLRHAQRLSSQPRAMLEAIPRLERVEPAEQEICCGSAGIYNLLQPEAAAGAGRPEGGERPRDRARRLRERQSRLPDPGHRGAAARAPADPVLPSSRARGRFDPGGRLRRATGEGPPMRAQDSARRT
jgi:hypothetical protein